MVSKKQLEIRKRKLQTKRRKFIRSNPKLSATAIQKKFKGTRLSLRRKQLLALIRGVRKRRAPTKERKAKSVRKKFKKPTPAEAPPASEYTISHVKDAGGNEYWIKHTDDESLNRQFQQLSNFYQLDEATFEVLETKPYAQFVAKEFGIVE